MNNKIENKYYKIEVIPEQLTTDTSYVKYTEDHVKLSLLDKNKDNIFSGKYLIVKASIRKSNLCDFNEANLYVKGELSFCELNIKNLIDIINLIE